MNLAKADFVHQAEMGFTHRELLKSLPSAVKPFQVEQQADLVYRLRQISQADAKQNNAGKSDLVQGPSGWGEADQEPVNHGTTVQQVMLTLSPESSRSIASFTLPVTGIKLEFFGFSDSRFDDFMQRFKQYLHKGGG